MKAGSSGLNSSGAPVQRGRGHIVHDAFLSTNPLAVRTNVPLASHHVRTDPGAAPRRPDQAPRHRYSLRRPAAHLAAESGADQPRRRRAFRTGRAARRPGRHPGAEQRPLFRADVRHPVDRRRHGAAQHPAGDARDRIHPRRLRRRGAVHRHRHGASPDGARRQDARRARGRLARRHRPRPRACCASRTSPTTRRPTMSAPPTTTSPASSTPAARRDAPRASCSPTPTSW